MGMFSSWGLEEGETLGSLSCRLLLWKVREQMVSLEVCNWNQYPPLLSLFLWLNLVTQLWLNATLGCLQSLTLAFLHCCLCRLEAPSLFFVGRSQGHSGNIRRPLSWCVKTLPPFQLSKSELLFPVISLKGSRGSSPVWLHMKDMEPSKSTLPLPTVGISGTIWAFGWKSYLVSLYLLLRAYFSFIRLHFLGVGSCS